MTARAIVLLAICGCGRIGFSALGSAADATDGSGSGDAAGSDAPAAPAAGLVAYYRLDETSGSTVADSSGTGNDAFTYWVGTPPTWTTGRFGGGLQLAPASINRVDIIGDATLAITGPWTVSAWISLASLPAQGDAFAIVVKPNAGSQHNYALFVDRGFIGTGSLAFSTAFHDMTGVEWVSDVTYAIQTATWYHVAATWDGTRLTIYVDGAASGATTPGMPPNGSSFPGQHALLGRNECCTQYLDGVIDDVRIYNRALATSEVAALYTTP